LGVRTAFDDLTLQSSMLTFHYVVSAKLWLIVTYTQAFWPDRTLVDPLLVARDQLLQTFYVLAVISNLWANVTDSLHNFTRRQHRKVKHTRQRTIFCTS